jgi:hypothetical protein
MPLSRDEVKAHLLVEMNRRFPGRNGRFPESLKIASLGFPSPQSLREWGKRVNSLSWYRGWFTPSEFMACVTFGLVPGSDKPNLIDLMYRTQTRPPQVGGAGPSALSLASNVTSKARAAKSGKATKPAAKARPSRRR